MQQFKLPIKKYLFSIILLTGLGATVMAQHNDTPGDFPRLCGDVEIMQKMQAENPAAYANVLAAQKSAERYIETHKNAKSQDDDVIYIPTVVHVVYKNQVQNISDEQVLSQIEVLNEDFRRLNLDAVNTRDSFKTVAADTRIEFCLANTDPFGNPFNGIDRFETDTASFDIDDNPRGWDNVKYNQYGGVTAWDRNEYLNIWVCNLDNGGYVLGYAYPPGGDPALDGVVIHYRYFGNQGVVSPPYNLGRTATHEIGHWLGLRHVWGDGGCGVDDGIGDTPTSSGPYYGCPSATATSCGSLDMHENYMDYTNDGCMNAFTEGQSTKMHAVLNTSRTSIVISSKCWQNTGIEGPSLVSEGLVNLYPNPVSNGGLFLSLDKALSKTASVVLSDLQGRVLLTTQLEAGIMLLNLDVSELTDGMYFISLQNEDIQQTVKFFVAN